MENVQENFRGGIDFCPRGSIKSQKAMRFIMIAAAEK